MKLNYKRIILVGFAFFLIQAFWQAYDNTIPMILTNKFGMSQAWSGAIMALDNVLALFMLPLFGAISDKHHSKWGRRTPFIVVGTLIAAVMLIALSFVDNAQLHHISDVAAIDDPAALDDLGLLNGKKTGGTARYFVSDTPDNFDELAHTFLGEYAGGTVERIAIETY